MSIVETVAGTACGLVRAYHIPEIDGVMFPGYELHDPSYEDVDPVIEYQDEGTPVEDIGTLYQDRLIMNDSLGTEYDLVRCESADPKTTVLGVKETALFTQPGGSVNVYIASLFMAMGYNFWIKGAEIGSSIPQSRSAYNTHKALDVLQRDGVFNAQRLALEGLSRGADISFGNAAYAEMFGRDIEVIGLSDPGPGVEIGPNRESVEKALLLGRDLGMVVLSVIKSVKHIHTAPHLSSNVDASLNGLRQGRRNLKPLLNGEALRMAARMPRNIRGVVALYMNCGFNDSRAFGLVLSQYDNLEVKHPGGGHVAAIEEPSGDDIAKGFMLPRAA